MCYEGRLTLDVLSFDMSHSNISNTTNIAGGISSPLLAIEQHHISLAEFAASQNGYSMVQLISVRHQVVAGSNWYFKMKVLKDAEEELENEDDVDARPETAEAVVYEVPWTNSLTVTKFDVV